MPHTLSDEAVLLLSRMGNYKRYCNKRKELEAGKCPFCPPIDPNVNTVLFENSHFMVWEVPQDYSRRDNVLELYLIIVPRQHTNTLANHSREFWVRLGEMCDWAYRHYEIPGGALIARLGDPRYSAATETHLHFNVKVPNLKDELREAIAKKPEDVKKNELRGQVFAHLYEQGVTPEAFHNLLKARNISEKEYVAQEIKTLQQAEA